jgi:dolichol-phosphate mannosyltransferase
MKDKENSFVSAVIYVHNTQGVIGVFIEKLVGILTEFFLNYEIICVNDSSTDDSAIEIRNAVQYCTGSSLVIIDMGFYQGLENSMNAGVDYACGDFVFEFDKPCIGYYEFDLIMNVYYRCLQGYDIVGASPKTDLKISSRFFYFLFNRNSNIQYELKTESFYILSRRAINRIKQLNVALPYRKAAYANCGLRIDSLEYIPNRGFSLIQTSNDADRSALAVDSFILFTDIAYKISLNLSLIMIVFSAFVGIYTLVIFISKEPVAGWTTTMLVLSFGFFGIFGILSLVIRYLSIILKLIFKKTNYVTGNIEKL